MNSEKTLKAIEAVSKVGIIPVVVLNDAGDAKPLGEALVKGGLPAAEVTFRTDAAEESIKILSREYPEMYILAGTVLTVAQVDKAVNAGAKMIVSPGFDPEIVQYCLANDIPVCPGTQTPSEVIAAYKFGLDHVKFFPAENAGGLPMIKAVGAAMVNMKFMPTGGINATNVREYLECEKIFACGGSWMVKSDMISGHDFAAIEAKAREAHEIVKEIRG